MKKTEGQKSRGTVPLKIVLKFIYNFTVIRRCQWSRQKRAAPGPQQYYINTLFQANKICALHVVKHQEGKMWLGICIIKCV